MDQLRAIRSFAAIVEAHGYSAAARQLGLSRSHLSKQIRELEDHLGARLLNRTTRRVGLTPLGQAYYDRWQGILRDIDTADSDLMALQGTPRGALRLLAPKSFAVLELAEPIHEFGRRFPELEVQVYLLDAQLDLVEHGFDLALRFGAQTDHGLIVTRLCAVRSIVCATPAYLRRHGSPRHPEELRQHACLRHLALSRDRLWQFTGPDGEVAVPVRGALSANSTLLLRDAVLQGHGIGLLPSYSVQREIRSGQLTALLREYAAPEMPLYIVYPQGRHLTAKARLLIDFLVNRFRAGWAGGEAATPVGRRNAQPRAARVVAE